MTSLIYLITILSASPVQDSAMAEAVEAYRRGQFDRVVELLEPEVEKENPRALLLSADAHYALQTSDSIQDAITLYERCLYDVADAPFPDHSYFRLGSLYMDPKLAGRDIYEAENYFKQLLKKYPQTSYREEALKQLLSLADEAGRSKKYIEYATTLWRETKDPQVKQATEGIGFIMQDPFIAGERELRAVFNRSRPLINRFPTIMAAYSRELKRLGASDIAAGLLIESYNRFPDKRESLAGLLEAGVIHEELNEIPEGVFLYTFLLEGLQTPESLKDQVYLRLLGMLERGTIHGFTAANRDWTYFELLDKVSSSSLDPAIRAENGYKLALIHAATGDSDQALLTLANLTSSYLKGPLAGLYRETYHKLLFQVIEHRFGIGDYWGLDRLYQRHRNVLAFTVETRYPDLIAEGYLRLNLPASAIQVYENLWLYKKTLNGFDLAFEAIFTKYLHLLNKVRHERLDQRLDGYEAVYGQNDRFWDQFLWLRSAYEDRTMEPAEFLAQAKTRPLKADTVYDVMRLRLVLLNAQEIFDWNLSDELFAEVQRWPRLEAEMPELARSAELYQADRMFMRGNYSDSKRRYSAILANQAFPSDHRDWAYLQLARLYELDGNSKRSLRIYGQIVYSDIIENRAWAIFAERRLVAMANGKQIREAVEELQIGQN